MHARPQGFPSWKRHALLLQGLKTAARFGDGAAGKLSIPRIAIIKLPCLIKMGAGFIFFSQSGVNHGLSDKAENHTIQNFIFPGETQRLGVIQLSLPQV